MSSFLSISPSLCQSRYPTVSHHFNPLHKIFTPFINPPYKHENRTWDSEEDEEREQRFQNERQAQRAGGEERSEIGFGHDRFAQERRSRRQVHVGRRWILVGRAGPGREGSHWLQRSKLRRARCRESMIYQARISDGFPFSRRIFV